jgi:CBS domain-containing protein
MMEELYEAKVRDVMIPRERIPFMEENAGWEEFLAKLSVRAHAWVVNNREEMQVVGIVTEHDILRNIIPPTHRKIRMFGVHRADMLHKETTVQDIMTHNPVVCSPEETMTDVLKKFASFNIRRLAVVDEKKRLLGEITIQLLVRNLRHKFTSTE